MTATPVDVARWRSDYTAARNDLIQAYLAKPRPHPLLRGLSRAADLLFREIWHAHDLPRQAAMIAVGGFGRSELFPQSDVDILILLADDTPDEAYPHFEPLIGLFWDVGLPVGHSVRTLQECLDEASRDVTIQTNLLEARWLAGDQRLFAMFQQRFRASLDPRAFLDAKLLEQTNRHGRIADQALRLEPNIKEHPGGLRDMHMVGWICRAAGLPPGMQALANLGMITPAESRRINSHLRFLSHLRIRLHLATNRREDRLIFEQQESLAAQMGYTPKGMRRGSERLMQHYFLAARELALANEILLGHLTEHLKPAAAPLPLPSAPGFIQRGTLLDVEQETIFEADPGTILDAFLVLQKHPQLTGMAPRGLHGLWRAGGRINAAFRRNPAHRRQFLALLREPRGVTQVFRLMHRLGILGRYLPAFGRITGQMQHDLYHIYPVDEHTLMVFRNLRRLSLPEFAHEFPLAHRLLTEFDRPDLLYLAALFHDIAKGRGGDHSTLGAVDTRRFCRQHGLPEQDTELVTWLVQQHLILSATAQKQDISDPDVVERFARQCGELRRLTALYLLTVADIRGTNPGIWNAWKEKLLRELYLASRNCLEGGQPALDTVETKKEQARASLRLYGYSDGAEKGLWNRLDDVWFLRLSAQEIAWQTRRLLPLVSREKVIVRARLASIGEGVEVMVYAPDEEALFARICGFFARLSYSVVEAKIHSTRDGYALDSFLVLDERGQNTPYRDLLNYIEYELATQLREKVALMEVHTSRLPRQLKTFPLQPEVSITPVEHGSGHLLSFTAGDRPGLLYGVARILNQHGVNVLSAKVNTLGQRAEDVFVLDGAALTRDSEKLALEQELLACLGIPSQPA